MTDPRFPVGPFVYADDPKRRAERIEAIRTLPQKLNQALDGLTEEQLDTPYRDGGWTVRQVVHHFADSHLNAFTRFRLAATEENPTIRPYDEAAWAELDDARVGRLEPSIAIIRGVHQRWAAQLDRFADADFRRPLVHPESGDQTLDSMLASYAWHCLHHVAHITELRSRMGL